MKHHPSHMPIQTAGTLQWVGGKSAGYVRTAYWFEDDGSYTYERSGPERQDEETGSYIVQGERLILSPDGKPQRTMQWWIGTEATALEGESILWLVDQYGRKEMFYPQR